MESAEQRPSVLLAEGNAVVAIDLVDALEDAGYRVIGPYDKANDALDSLRAETPDLAILDPALKDDVCTRLLNALRQTRIPFLVHTGLHGGDPRLAGFQGSPWIAKPALPSDLVEALKPLMEHHAARHGQVNGTGNPLVRKLEGFVELSSADRAMLERISANPRVIPSRTDLIREGNTPSSVFLILKGMACRHKMRANGQSQILAYLVPGDFCDIDVGLLKQMDHALSTLSECKVVRIAPETIKDILDHHPAVAKAMRMATLVDEGTLREWLANIGFRSALERIAHLFCELLVRMDAVGFARNNSFDLPLSQGDLGNTTGLSTVHVNRTLQELRRRGLIELRGRRLTILDLPRLRNLAEFKPNYLHLGERAAA